MQGERARLRLLPGNAGPRTVSSRGAHRRLDDSARGAVRSHEGHRADVGHADRRGTFDYIRSRLGLEQIGRARVSSSCRRSSTTRARPSCTCRGRCPTRDRRSSPPPPAREIIGILEASQGRAFVLFTSYAAMRAVQAIAEIELPLSDPRAGIGAALGAARAVPDDAERGAAGHVELLAGRRRDGRGAELRHHRQAALRVARRSRSPPPASRRSPSAAASRSATTRCRWPSSRCCRGWAA